METVTLDTPKNTIAAIPALIGHYPKDSVVIMFLDENKLSLTSRIDAKDSLELKEYLWTFISNVCFHNNYTSVIVIHFGERVDQYAEAIAHLSALCDEYEGPALIDALIVDNEGNYRSIDSDAEGGKMTKDDYQTSAVSIGCIVGGSHIADSRDEIADEIKTAKRTNKIHKEATTIADGLMKSKEEVIDYRWAAYHFSTAVLDDPSPSVVDLVALGIMAQDVKVRDAIVHHIVKSGDPRGIRSKLMQGLQYLPERQATALLAMVGVSSYVSGDGMRASMAVDKCLEIDGNYALAALMDAAIHRAVPPSVWGELVGSMTIEEVLL